MASLTEPPLIRYNTVAGIVVEIQEISGGANELSATQEVSIAYYASPPPLFRSPLIDFCKLKSSDIFSTLQKAKIARDRSAAKSGGTGTIGMVKRICLSYIGGDGAMTMIIRRLTCFLV